MPEQVIKVPSFKFVFQKQGASIRQLWGTFKYLYAQLWPQTQNSPTDQLTSLYSCKLNTPDLRVYSSAEECVVLGHSCLSVLSCIGQVAEMNLWIFAY